MGRNRIGLDTWKTITIKDPDGKIVKQYKKRCESFVVAFINILWASFRKKDSSVIDTTNTSRTVNYKTRLAVNSPANNSVYGIQVGTGNTAEDVNDYVLDTQITHGTGAGELQYGAVSFGAPSVTATTTEFTVTRIFTNGSGGSIGVNEIGLTQTSGGNYFLLIRDVLGSTDTILDSGTYTIDYTLKTTI